MYAVREFNKDISAWVIVRIFREKDSATYYAEGMAKALAKEIPIIKVSKATQEECGAFVSIGNNIW
jgi:hypothetical protein